MKTMLRGITAFVAVIITTVLLATGATAATPDQQNTANYVSSMRNAAGLPSLSVNEQMNTNAQAWADHLAAQDSRNLSTNPNIYQPSGTTDGNSVVAYYSRNDPQAAMDSSWGTNAGNKSVINTPSWNTVGTGFAIGKSGAIYLVADMVHVNPPAVVVAPAPAPAPAPVVAAPAPVVVQPAPVEAAPVEQAPAPVEAAPAAPVEPAPAPEPAKPTPTPTAKATPTPTATPSATASASESATASPDGKSMDALRTSDSTSPVMGKESKQAWSFGLGGLLLISGGSLKFANRRQKGARP